MLETKVVRFLLSFAIILFHLSTCFVFGIISPKFVCLDMIIHHTLSKLQAEILKYLHFRLAIMRCYHVPNFLLFSSEQYFTNPLYHYYSVNAFNYGFTMSLLA